MTHVEQPPLKIKVTYKNFLKFHYSCYLNRNYSHFYESKIASVRLSLLADIGLALVRFKPGMDVANIGMY
jgi:hypothetical protein